MANVAPSLQRFRTQRDRLLVHLDDIRRQIDSWLIDPGNEVPSMHQLAALEGLLAQRKSLLSDLVKLDDEMLETLVTLRGAQS